MRLLKLLVILLIIVFPFGELLRFDVGNNIRFKPLDVISGLLSVSWFVLLITKRIKKPRVHWAFAAFPLVAVVSLAVNSVWLMPQELLVSSFYFIRWISYMMVFFVLLQFDDAFKNKIVKLLLLDGLMIVLLGYVQFFFFSSLKPLYYLGWDDHMYRLFSVFLDPNFTGGVLVLYLLFVLALLYKHVTQQTKYANKRYAVVLSFIALLTLLATFLTFSRSILLMLIVSVSIFFVLIGKKRLIVVLGGLMLIYVVLISPKFYVESMNLFRQASSVSRLQNYQTSIPIIQEHPLVGVGFNAYRYAKERYGIQMGWVNAPSHADAGVDNSLLFVLVTTGIMGLFSYLALWGYNIRRAYHYYKKEKNTYAIVVLSSCAGLFLHAMFINSLFFPAIVVWMWIQLGLMERTSH